MSSPPQIVALTMSTWSSFTVTDMAYTVVPFNIIISEKWVTRNHDEKLLPGLGKYSQRQMFWISAANVWCAKYRDKALKLRVLTGVHSPDMFRDDRSLGLRGTFLLIWKNYV